MASDDFVSLSKIEYEARNKPLPTWLKWIVYGCCAIAVCVFMAVFGVLKFHDWLVRLWSR